MLEIYDGPAVLERPTKPSNDTYKCEDCPDTNPNPPARSDCKFFETARNGEPMCTKDDGTMKALDRLINGGGYRNCGSVICFDLVDILETGAQLPDTYPVN